MNTYVVEVKDMYENKPRTLKVESKCPQDAHKTAFFKLITKTEEIVSMSDSDGKVVFDVNQGFRG